MMKNVLPIDLLKKVEPSKSCRHFDKPASKEVDRRNSWTLSAEHFRRDRVKGWPELDK